VYATAGDVDFNRTPAGSVIVTGRPAIATPFASLTVAVTESEPAEAVPVESTAPLSDGAEAVVVVADGDVTIVDAVRAET